MPRFCSHFPERCELPAEGQSWGSSAGGATWSGGDSTVPLWSAGGTSLFSQVVPGQAWVLPILTQRGSTYQDLQHLRDLCRRKSLNRIAHSRNFLPSFRLNPFFAYILKVIANSKFHIYSRLFFFQESANWIIQLFTPFILSK